jgi:hypothetical protein
VQFTGTDALGAKTASIEQVVDNLIECRPDRFRQLVATGMDDARFGDAEQEVRAGKALEALVDVADDGRAGQRAVKHELRKFMVDTDDFCGYGLAPHFQ